MLPQQRGLWGKRCLETSPNFLPTVYSQFYSIPLFFPLKKYMNSYTFALEQFQHDYIVYRSAMHIKTYQSILTVYEK